MGSNFASIAVEIPEYEMAGNVEGVLTTHPELPSQSLGYGFGETQRIGLVAWINSSQYGIQWPNSRRRLAIYAGGDYVMGSSAPIVNDGGSSAGSVVLAPGWTLLAIM